jgi:SPP1 family predicted phage head-tail adaptor
MLTPIGKLDNRITIQRRNVVQNTRGEDVEGWTDFAEVWAEKRVTADDEAFRAQQRLSTQGVNFRIRYRKGISPQMRVLCDGATWKVLGVAEINRREWLDLTCEAFDVTTPGGA